MTLSYFLSDYCDIHGYDFIPETPRGINVNLDDNQADKTYVFYNIIEEGSFEPNESGSEFTVLTTYEVAFFERCIKEDDGWSYLPIIKSVKSKALSLYKALNDEFDLQIASYTTGVDTEDSNNCVCKLTFSIKETYPIC